MHALIQIILHAYRMEGILGSHVAMLISQEAGATVFRCMAPQQHNSYRAVGVKQRLERQFAADHANEVMVQPGTVYAEGQSQVMHTVVVHCFSRLN